jgi:VanZ family protein
VGIRGGVSLLHVLSFALLTFLIRFMFSTRLYKTRIQNPCAWSVYTAVILAGILEILQVFMPTRHAKARDLLFHASESLFSLSSGNKQARKNRSGQDSFLNNMRVAVPICCSGT